ncbi:MAG: 3'-5' exonuclease [Deltaproteobacteria bacterium]|nr:3'-5' exonuclease [Deltaproteobacteria bacterium]
MARATWFCVDIECSGPVPGDYDMISLGACRVHHAAEGLEIGAPWYVEIAPQGPKVDAGAMKVNGLDLDRLRAEGAARRQALLDLSAWVTAQTLPGTKPVFVGHNAPFDWSFVNWAYHAEGIVNPFGYKALDTKALAMGVLAVHWFDSHKERLDALLDLPPVEQGKVHRADYDAWYQAHILARLLERMALPPAAM